MPTTALLQAALASARQELLAARNEHGHWTGELSSSAASTATAVCAFAVAQRYAPQTGWRYEPLIWQGLDWLAAYANPDGGWGDTVLSTSNLSTTVLGWAAFGAVRGAEERYPATVTQARDWLTRQTGRLEPDQLMGAVMSRYGKDRSFSAPILTVCALAGRLGQDRTAWKLVPALPFERAALPRRCFAGSNLPVVSYALPALIAIGQVRYHHRPPANPLRRMLRFAVQRRTLRVLEELQSAGGGFLEAPPLTGLVVMSLAASGQAAHPVVERGIEFLIRSVRPDGSWPVDADLATSVTTLSIEALAAGEGTTGLGQSLDPLERASLREWLLGQQRRTVHPCTRAAPGGWAWTDRPGGAPNAHDTASALLALRVLGEPEANVRAAAESGIGWLLGMQNRDGGLPAFRRAAAELTFDRSSPELTASAVQAWAAWRRLMPEGLQRRVRRALGQALDYLARTQSADGAWVPLWFGNQHEAAETNPTYGTARVVIALAGLSAADFPVTDMLLLRGARWLQHTQRRDGSWGGSEAGPASIEETALATEALAAVAQTAAVLESTRGAAWRAMDAGARWLARMIGNGAWREPAPIGLYFPRLWYYERLYPMIFTVRALGCAARLPQPAPWL